MSEYVVHFTKEHSDEAGNVSPAVQVLDQILTSRHLEARKPYGQGKGLVKLGASQLCVCFSEIPLDLLSRLVDRRSSYGLGFRKDFLARHGGARVWYIDGGGPIAKAYGELERSKYSAWDDPFWRLTPFIDLLGERFRFEWEREWRVAGPQGLPFDAGDVAFLFLPQSDHSWIRNRFESLYHCPLIDPLWEPGRLQEAAAAIRA